MKLLCAALVFSFGVFAQDDSPAPATPPAVPAGPPREQARSMIVTQYGIVAASQFLASQAGAKMLEAGGNAIDAAIAANAVLGLTQPYVNGHGRRPLRDCLRGENRQGLRPELERLDAQGAHHRVPEVARASTRSIRSGVHTITVPGCVAGWDALRRRFGTKTFPELLASAIFYAENGFPLPEIGRAVLDQPRRS